MPRRLARGLLGLLGAGSCALASLAAAELPAARSIWIDPARLAALPTSGPAWESLFAAAQQPTNAPNLADQNDATNVRVLAKALVYARTGEEHYRSEVWSACQAVIGTEVGGSTLALGRELAAYVLAADLVGGLPAEIDAVFRPWLSYVRTEDLQGATLISTHELRPNNWGTNAGASRMAVAAYLGDAADLARAAQVFRGWLGDRSAYAGFHYGNLWWQADPAAPVGINPRGASRDGHSIDGVLPDDQRRNGIFQWPPPPVNYVYGALQGALVQAVILERAGYDVWEWQDRALLRAFRWLDQEAHYPAQGDDNWEPHLINFAYHSQLPAPVPTQPGKIIGWTDWTHPGTALLAAFDFDADGGSDLLRIDSTDGAVEVLRNGRVEDPEVLSLAAPPTASIVARGDFDGNAISDLLWQRNGERNLTAWLVGTTGAVEPADLPTPGPQLRLLGVGDLDRDGRADLAFEDFGSRDIHLWLLDGAALREESVIPGPPRTWLLVGIADVDADHRSDFVWWEPPSGAVRIWHMSGATVLADSLLSGALPVGAKPIGLGDYDRDGAADLFVRLATGGSIAVSPIRDGVASFAVVATTPGAISAAAGHDFDGDGVADLVLVDLAARSVSPLLLGPNAPGTVPIDYSNAALPGDLAHQIGDNDGDWYPDSCDADFNNDGATGLADFLLYARCVGKSPIGECASVDINGDGVTGLPEFLVMGSVFGHPVCSGLGTP